MAIKFVYLIPFLFVLLANGEPGPDDYTLSEVVNFISDLKQHTAKSANIECLLAAQPPKSINVQEDASALHSAIENRAIDEIIKIISHRSLVQRLEIASAFKNTYKENLADGISSLDTIEVRTLIFDLLLPPWEYHAKELYNAIHLTWSTDEEALIETLVPLSNSAAKSISDYYERKYQVSLVDEIKRVTSGAFKSLLLFMSAGKRFESHRDPNDKTAVDAAHNLHEYANMTTFNSILATTSFPQLRKIFIKYKKISGRDIDADIEEKFSGNAKDTYLCIVEFAKNEPEYFAKLINKSLSGRYLSYLVRVLVGRSDIDLGNIKVAYEDIYGISLTDKIKEKYNDSNLIKLVLALLGN